MIILQTERLVLRELDPDRDAEFLLELLNTPKFIQYIGDRGVRSLEQSAEVINGRYRASYRENGYGLYGVVLRESGECVGICGFVKRDHFDSPDIGFAFLPDHEGKGYGSESSSAILNYGRDKLGFTRVLAITSKDNDVSGKLLDKLGFRFNGLFTDPEGQELKLFEIDL